MYDVKNDIKNKLLIIESNLDRCSISVSESDLVNVHELLSSDDIDLLIQCSNEMDDIVNGISINIDNELKGLKVLGVVTDYDKRIDILNKIVSISNCIIYDNYNKNYFMGLIKEIYNNINGDDLC